MIRSFCLSLLMASYGFFCLADERIVLVAGGSVEQVNVPAVQAKLHEPFGAEWDRSGNLWIIEMIQGNRLLKIDVSGELSHVAGVFYTQSEKSKSSPSPLSAMNPREIGDGGTCLTCRFFGPHNLAISADQRILVADTWHGLIRVIDPGSDRVSSLAAWKAPADQARSRGPYCIAVDRNGKQLYVADLRQVHQIDLSTGTSKIIAGNGEKGVPKDGSLAADSPLVDPRAVCVDSRGNVYILERNGNALRVVTTDGKIKTVVNASGEKGMSIEQGKAIDSLLSGPKHLCVDLEDRVVIADAENHVIVRYDPSKATLERIAGTGKAASSGIGGHPLQCSLARPHGVSVHPVTGHLYITDSYNHRILKIEP